MDKKAGLKDRERKILEFMKEEIDEKGYPPTVREICQAVHIKSTSTAHKDINNLVNKGYLKKDPSKPRALMLVQEKVHEFCEDEPETEMTQAANVANVPIIGRVAAGVPITAMENVEGTLPVPAEYAPDSCFMLRVKGTSMVNIGIMDGDLILVHKQNTAENGDVVVAMVDGFESEATVKTFYRENGHIRLQPENDSMSPIIVRDVSIQGKVKGVFRFF